MSEPFHSKYPHGNLSHIGSQHVSTEVTAASARKPRTCNEHVQFKREFKREWAQHITTLATSFVAFEESQCLGQGPATDKPLW